MKGAHSIDVRGSVLFLARVAAVLLPPLFLANALLAAPKTPAAAKKPPVVKVKDTGPDAADAPAKDGGKETVLKSDAASTIAKSTNDSGDQLVKESEKKEGDASVKVFEFGTTNIEGRSRWPAVTYFVRRMRAEFDATKLPHRPFLPELAATKGDPAVK